MEYLFERPDSGERALLVQVNLQGLLEPEDAQEFALLVNSAGATALATMRVNRSEPTPGWFIGRGKVDELAQWVADQQADLVIFNHSLSPTQERNLERVLQCRVVDRTGLILDIFAQRARTHEGKLQVELAQLDHLSTRLVRGWTHLERQKGGIGLRGPGETQLETDRRLLRGRIKHIQDRLVKVRKQRDQGRRARQRAEIPTVSLVGYTNAGKSTLFNRLTEAEVYAADQLFATLDPTLRRISIPELGTLVLADTVGFVRRLPHQLVAAFRATLEETKQADLLLHVVDASSEERMDTIAEVNRVLTEIEANGKPTLYVYNKIDLLAEMEPRIDRDDTGAPSIVWVSAQTGAGMELLEQALNERLGQRMVEQTLYLPPSLAGARAHCYGLNAVTSEQSDASGNMIINIRMPQKNWDQMCKRFNLKADQIGGRH